MSYTRRVRSQRVVPPLRRLLPLQRASLWRTLLAFARRTPRWCTALLLLGTGALLCLSLRPTTLGAPAFVFINLPAEQSAAAVTPPATLGTRTTSSIPAPAPAAEGTPATPSPAALAAGRELESFLNTQAGALSRCARRGHVQTFTELSLRYTLAASGAVLAVDVADTPASARLVRCVHSVAGRLRQVTAPGETVDVRIPVRLRPPLPPAPRPRPAPTSSRAEASLRR
jgi:hypothetical protein